MRKLIVAEFLSLDGVIQAPGGPDEDPSGGFRFGGWQAPFDDESIGKVIMGLFAQPFELLLGRNTYDIWASYWPRLGDASPEHPIDHPRLAPLQLAQHVLHLLIERHVALAVFGALAQHERLDHAAQGVGREFRMRNHQRLGCGVLAHRRVHAGIRRDTCSNRWCGSARLRWA